MKKHLVVLNGPMGVGKTAVGKRLADRVSRDIAAGKRAPGSVERSLSYQKFYPGQRTLHLDTSRLTPEEAAAAIAGLLGR